MDKAGLYEKYIVLHADGAPAEGRYFVLKPESDMAAREALRTYAFATEDLELMDDILYWLAEIATTEKVKDWGDLELARSFYFNLDNPRQPQLADIYQAELNRRNMTPEGVLTNYNLFWDGCRVRAK